MVSNSFTPLHSDAIQSRKFDWCSWINFSARLQLAVEGRFAFPGVAFRMSAPFLARDLAQRSPLFKKALGGVLRPAKNLGNLQLEAHAMFDKAGGHGDRPNTVRCTYLVAAFLGIVLAEWL